MRHLLLLVLLASTGCAATWKQRRYDPKGGIVSYRSSGFGISTRHEDALKKMAEYCAPAGYRIISETNGDQTTAYMQQGSVIAPLSDSYVYIDFNCL